MSNGIEDSFKRWVNNSKAKLRDMFSSQRLDERKLRAILDDTFSETRKGFIKGMGPTVYKAYLDGSIEAGFGMDKVAIENFAYNYAAQVADYANAMSSDAAVEAYMGALKRKQPPPKAFEFMRKAFGSDRRAVRSLLVQLENEESKDLTVGERSSQKQKNMDAYVAATIQRRAKLFGDEESFASKQMSKALVWNLAAKQGYLPPGTMKEWYTVRDERTCKTCGPMHRQQVNVTERFRTKEGKLLWGPQVHPNCFPSWVPAASATGITGANSRWYEGKLVVIHTSAGREVSVTPNHPILTSEGWVAAGDLKVGHNLVSYDVEAHGVFTSGPDNKSVEVPIRDVFESLRQTSGVSATGVPVTPEQFHGDGVLNTNVDVVLADGLLGNDMKPTLLDLPAESKLLLSSVSPRILVGDSTSPHFLQRDGAASDGTLREGDETCSLLGGGVSHSGVHGLGPSTDGDTGLDELSFDYVAGDSVSGGELFDALTGLVSLDVVTEVRDVDFAGHVYNLETGGGWFTANGIVVHNCRCQVKLVVVGTTKEKPQAPLTASQFARGKVSKMWSQNNWETQPRSPSGRFGERPGSKQKGMYSGTSLYAPKGSPIQPKQRQRVAVLERPADLRAQQMEQELEARAKQDVGTKSIEDALAELEAMPQVSAFDMIEDSDVLALTQPRASAAQGRAAVANAFFRAGATAANPVIKTQARVATRPKLNQIAVSASIPEMKALVANQPKVSTNTRIDVAATVLANAKPEEKAAVLEALKAGDDMHFRLEDPAFAALPAGMDGRLLGGTSFHEDPDMIVNQHIDDWLEHAEEAARKYVARVAPPFGLTEEEVVGMFREEAEKMAMNSLNEKNIAVDETSWAETMETDTRWKRARSVIDVEKELEQNKPVIATLNEFRESIMDSPEPGVYTLVNDFDFRNNGVDDGDVSEGGEGGESKPKKVNVYLDLDVEDTYVPPKGEKDSSNYDQRTDESYDDDLGDGPLY